MFKASNIQRISIININCFKHFDMFVVEATDDCENYLLIDGHFQELFYSSTGSCGIFFSTIDSLPGIFYSSTSLHLTKP